MRLRIRITRLKSIDVRHAERVFLHEGSPDNREYATHMEILREKKRALHDVSYYMKMIHKMKI